MAEMTEWTAREALDALARGEVSSEELTRAFLARIERLEDRVRAFITLTPDSALESARAADRRRAEARRSGETLPPLLGLPLAVKDLLALEGVPCTCGSRILEGFIPPYTATSVARLLEAGAVSLGKTNLDEFAMGSSTESSAYGVTRNPWNLDHVPGGSSGGSAAAVAARMAPAALGTDTGGSVRQPASFCGLTGIKPTYGRVSRYGLVAYGSSLDCVGVLARTAVDAALLLEVMAGHDPLDATSLDAPVPRFRFDQEPDLRGLRVGVPKEFFIEGMQPEVESAVRAAVARLADLGAEVIEISLPHTDLALPVYYLIAPAEASANLSRYDGVRYGLREPAGALWDQFKDTRGAGFGPEVKRRIMLGTYALSAGYYEAYYLKAQKVRTLIRRDFEQAFQKYDVLVAPTSPTTAFKIGERTEDLLAMYMTDVCTLPVNLAGLPGISIPCGFKDGLPIGLQLIGRQFDDGRLLQAAYAFEQNTDFHQRRPQLDGTGR